jgi:hypothetical protein
LARAMITIPQILVGIVICVVILGAVVFHSILKQD